MSERDPSGTDGITLRAERQRSEDALARLRDALEGVSDGVVVLNRAGAVLEANPAVFSETELEVDEVLGVPFLGLWEPPAPGERAADLRLLENAIRQASGPGESSAFQEPLRLRVVGTGKAIAVRVRVTPRYREGRLDGAVVYLRFLTEEERLRGVARAWEDRYRTVFAAAGDPMALLDSAGRYLEINDRYCELSGFEREELLGRSLDSWTYERRDRDALAWWIERLETGTTARLGITRTRRDREVRQVDMTLTGVRLAGRPCALVIERDVSARRQRQLEAEVAARVGRLLVDSLDVRAVLPAIAEQIRRFEPFSRMTVLTRDEDGSFRIFASWDLEGIGSPTAGAVLPPDTILSDVQRQARPVRRIGPGPSAGDDTEGLPRGQLIYPLAHRGGVVGLVTLDGVSPEASSAETGMAIVAPALASAVENARLFRQLRESEEKFRTLVENAREIIFRRAMTGDYRYVNPVVEQALGYPPEAFYRDPGLARRLIHPADLERHGPVFRGMLEGTDYPALEVRLRHRSGKRWIWFLLSAFPLRDPAGNLVALEGILRDITVRKEAEAAAREYERRLLALGELSRRLTRERTPRRVAAEALRGLVSLFGAQGGVVAVRRHDGQGLEVLAADGGTESASLHLPDHAAAGPIPSPLIRAQASGEIVEMYDLSTVPRDAAWAGELVSNGFLGTVAAPIAGGESARGALALHFSRPSPLGDHGHTVLHLAAVQVATALERAEQIQTAGRHARGAERAARDLEMIREVIARDLRAPVASLAGLAEMIRRPSARAPGKSGVLADRIVENARVLDATLDGLLRLLHAGVAVPDIRAVDPEPVVGDLIEGHARRLGERGGVLDVSPEWPRVMADLEALREVLDELLDNAVRHAGHGQAPRVGLHWSAATDRAVVELAVEDNGPGLEPPDRSVAFEPFRKLENAEGHAGAGVGLALARRRAEAMGGELVLREGDQGGCRAVLRLRRAAPDVETDT